eukprot:9277681-Alexandrium_andersonii.AAC.1
MHCPEPCRYRASRKPDSEREMRSEVALMPHCLYRTTQAWPLIQSHGSPRAFVQRKHSGLTHGDKCTQIQQELMQR